jgi:hypothetical protein
MLMLTGYLVGDDNIVRQQPRKRRHILLQYILSRTKYMEPWLSWEDSLNFSDWDSYFAIVMVYESPSQK